MFEGLNLNVTLAIFVLAFFACGRQKAVLKWQDTSGVEDGFRIYRITGQKRA